MANNGFGLEFDTKSFERGLSRIEKQGLPEAQAGFLNGLAFGARKELLSYANRTIQGGPTPWTKRGFVVDKAASGKSPTAVVRIQDQQARYMDYQVNGGKRRKGDPGATPYDVLTDAPDSEKNAFGNLKRGYLKRLARQAKTEKTKRARLHAKRDKLRAAGKSTKPARWATNTPSGNAGIFFGKIGGQKGYWQRARKRDGDYRLTLLARLSDEADYKPSFQWDETVNASVRDQDPQKLYATELARALRKLGS
ncbi:MULTISPECIES: hypothetical protein [Rhizobium]|uniref:hypothetical protein n=1 Tax=Rhizobium TaxID=379 RepID=UPI0003F86502|nr:MULTISPECIES: hypothetical protein [Rhizobium]UFS81529.1 hypothetical protein LPB79_24980 [Rhizobium sp. T136]